MPSEASCACTDGGTFADRDAKGGELDPWLLSELLMDVGAMSVSVDDADLGTGAEVPLLHEHTNSKVRAPTTRHALFPRPQGCVVLLQRKAPTTDRV